MFLQIKNVVKHFDGVKAVDGISLEVAKGEFISIMGPSGSGKTTLLTLIGLLDHPTSGEIIVEGERLSTFKDEDLFRSEKIGFVFQFHDLIEHLTALENAELPMYGLKSRDERKTKATELLRLVGLGERLHHKPSELSGGERQRVAVARALVNDPALVLADEPTGELDSHASVETIALMRRINKEKGTTFIIVTHDPEVTKKTDRIVFLKDGKVSREELVKSESLEDIMALKNSAFGYQVVQQKATDPYMEKLGLFKGGKLTKDGEVLFSVLERAEELEKAE